MTLNKTSLVKNVVGAVVGVSTTALTHAVIKNNVNEPETLAQKATVVTGSTVFGWMVSEKAREWTDSKIDQAIASWKEAKAEVAKAKTETTS
jgi:hypothetical protein